MQLRDSSLPFFIHWGASTPLPGRAKVVHRAGDVVLGELTINGNERRLHEWLGTTPLPIRVTSGIHGVASFTVLTSTNTIVVNPDDW